MIHCCALPIRLIISLFIPLILLFSYTFVIYRSDKTYVEASRSISKENYHDLQNPKLSLMNQTDEEFHLITASSTTDIHQQSILEQCSLLPSDFVGSVKPDLSSYTIEQIEENYANSNIQLGGHWFPSICTARDRVAIIIPYHHNHKQLHIFLNFMHRFLQKQQLDYQIFLIEPIGNITINRGLLFNIGYAETMKHYDWHCLIFHDVNLIPMNDRNIYSCPPEPRVMSVAVNMMNHKLRYPPIFRSIWALTVEQFESINGYSNQFFRSSGEDDDMATRVLTKYRISRYPATIARYKILQHRRITPNPIRHKILKLGPALHSIDGLSNLHYTVLRTTKEKLFTHILVTYDEDFIRASVAHINRKYDLSNTERSVEVSEYF